MLDGRDPQQFDYPFDQYQRYEDVRTVTEIIRTQLGQKQLRILDVGGTINGLTFLQNHQVITANPEIDSGVTLQTDGLELPFKASEFDVVVTVDTLEHVPPDKRATFVQELLRLTGQYLIITGPFANGYNEAAERILNNFLEDVLGFAHRFLQEHLEYGLPELPRCLDWIERVTPHHVCVPSGYVQHWLPLMLIRHYVGQFVEGHNIVADLDRLYNQHHYWADHQLPSYRQIIIAAKAESPALSAIERTFKRLETSPPLDLQGVIATLEGLRWAQTLKKQDETVRAQDAYITSLHAELERLQNLVTGYQTGRFMRLMAALQQLKGLLSR